MNTLYPIFLKAHQLQFLIVGGGEVGEEKIHNLLRSSPEAKVRLVAPDIKASIYKMAEKHAAVEVLTEGFEPQHLEGVDIAIIATEKADLNRAIREQAKAAGIVTNVADTPDLCDFYMCSVVTKGDLKIGISTNGKSPTFAKRFRQVLEEILPDSLPELLNQLRTIRDRLKGDFAVKVEELNLLTRGLVEKEAEKPNT
ncbi:MAG: bifunctional precorrin-2 dehydrogenase/sirohydrochlorin ferrochelatase [Bacteroidota bacterium]